MFDAKNHVLQCLENINKGPITTAELANELGLSRSMVRHYLNELVKNNKVIKLNGRPVKWQKKTDNLSQLEDCFADYWLSRLHERNYYSSQCSCGLSAQWIKYSNNWTFRIKVILLVKLPLMQDKRMLLKLMHLTLY